MSTKLKWPAHSQHLINVSYMFTNPKCVLRLLFPSKGDSMAGAWRARFQGQPMTLAQNTEILFVYLSYDLKAL